ncbi:hypothetical protein [Streptomyces prunicolor]|uniref:hypothetical protein n=1 Tax=Streptomyces prunicolor TaxID=67348 RepID=UPI00343ADF41
MRARAATVSLLLLLLSACSVGSNRSESVKTTPSPHSSPSATSSPLDLKLPNRAEYLIPVTSGTKDMKLKTFTPTGDFYIVHMKCTGNGSTSIEYLGSANPTKITCNDPAAIGRVYADPEAQHLSIHVNGSNVRWSIAILAA